MKLYIDELLKMERTAPRVFDTLIDKIRAVGEPHYIRERFRCNTENVEIRAVEGVTSWGNFNENNKTMKYKVITDNFEGIEKGTVVRSSTEAQGIAYFPGDNKWYANEHYINAHKDFFEPVEEVESGDWIIGGSGTPLYVNKVLDGYYSYTKYRDGSPTTDGRLEKKNFGRKATTPEIEQALKDEAKRRGFDKNDIVYYDADWESKLQKELKFEYLEYDRDLDWLTDGWGHVIYKEGNFSEIVDQTPDIEINGNKVEFNDHPKVGCTTIDKDYFITIAKIITTYGGQFHRNGEDITDQILAIAIHYGYEDEIKYRAGDTIIRGTLKDVTFSDQNMWGNDD